MRTDRPTAGPRGARRSAITVGAAGAFTPLGGGSVYALIAQSAGTQDPLTTTAVNCATGTDRAAFERFPDSTATLLDAVTGDPVADCVAEYERADGAAPPLTGYSTGASSVTVVPTGWAVPVAWTPLATSFRSDPRRLEFKHRLDDLVDGPQASCMSTAAAEAVVRAELSDPGLAGWTLRPAEGTAAADGTTTCAFSVLGGTAAPKVLMLSGPGGAADQNTAVFDAAAVLRADISDGCLTLPVAARATEGALANAGISVGDAMIAKIDDPAVKCTRVDFVPAGRTVVIFRGPAG